MACNSLLWHYFLWLLRLDDLNRVQVSNIRHFETSDFTVQSRCFLNKTYKELHKKFSKAWGQNLDQQRISNQDLCFDEVQNRSTIIRALWEEFQKRPTLRLASQLPHANQGPTPTRKTGHHEQLTTLRKISLLSAFSSELYNGFRVCGFGQLLTIIHRN